MHKRITTIMPTGIAYKQYKECSFVICQTGLVCGVASSAGGDFRHTGHVKFIRSHSSIHSAWKQCLHSGMHLIVSLLRYSDKHIGQMLSLGPGILRLSPSTSFSYDSIVDSSSPVTTTAGCGSTAAGLLFRCMGLSEA